jgi:DNA-binding PadR family transcriptional regulator
MDFDSSLVKGSTAPIVLRLLQERPMYGYEIVKLVNQRTGGRLEWREGSLYPCLHRLEGQGYLHARWEAAPSGKRRKYYHITPKGEVELAHRVKEWREFSASLNVLLLGTKGP